MARKFLVSRVALAVALSSGLAVVAATPAVAAKKEKAGATNFSPEFVKVAAPIQKAMADATAKISGGQATPENLAAAKQAFDAGVGGDGKAVFQNAVGTATTPDDKSALGSMMRNYGIISQDLALKQQGNMLLLESGKLDAAAVGSTNYDAGVTAYQMKDYPNSAKYLKAAKDAGYVDSSGQLDLVLADAYKRSNNPQAALQMAKDDIAAAQAKGAARPNPRCATFCSRPTPQSSSDRRPNMRPCWRSTIPAPGTLPFRSCASSPRCRVTRTSISCA
ncbi:hypothetical protein [Novosphingobium panipatense]|uniref:hypothetical protein n=1 Tax=Novosphingobium panipatense TaxID=428991 RepID=UPI003612C6A7